MWTVHSGDGQWSYWGLQGLQGQSPEHRLLMDGEDQKAMALWPFCDFWLWPRFISATVLAWFLSLTGGSVNSSQSSSINCFSNYSTWVNFCWFQLRSCLPRNNPKAIFNFKFLNNRFQVVILQWNNKFIMLEKYLKVVSEKVSLENFWLFGVFNIWRENSFAFYSVSGFTVVYILVCVSQSECQRPLACFL